MSTIRGSPARSSLRDAGVQAPPVRPVRYPLAISFPPVKDHSHNYLIGPATDRQRWHAKNFTDIVDLTLKTYRAGITPSVLAEQMIDFADERGFADYMVPGFEHGIGLMGDEWRIGLNDGPFPYWTNPDHVYQAGELLICAMQYACPEEDIGFRYENPIVLGKDSCEPPNRFPLSIDVIE